MALKMSGAECKAFCNDEKALPKGVYIEEDVYKLNGVLVDGDALDVDGLADNGEVEVVSGFIAREEDGECVSSLSAAIRKWQKTQKLVILVVEAPIEKAAGIKAAIKAAGGKVKR